MVKSKERLGAAGIHLAISLCIAAAAALLVFAVWYPFPYREVSGGRELFLIVTTVDVILGPLITLTIFNRQKKSARELTLDLSIVGMIQLAALAYGLWTVAAARPVHLVFEFDRMRVVHSIEIPEELLAKAPATIVAEPWTGPTPIAVRGFRSEDERVKATLEALQGVALSARPDLWETYDAARPRISAAAKPVADLKRKLPAQAAALDAALQKIGRGDATTSYLPLNSRKLAWTVFLDPKTADIVGFAPVDSF